ncbi:hypothetical protein BLNAU_12667 [Blattamonas nauphoetae]|uniref:Uncharacterized protein n=1 Tax=Blattamonas nauphoetae TaxID=2049346 RepID=A0ABQ9XQK4_9EUKA|nr:hypothetical protein BLNAU_12667 [Blattamonas nauphoetae]
MSTIETRLAEALERMDQIEAFQKSETSGSSDKTVLVDLLMELRLLRNQIHIGNQRYHAMKDELTSAKETISKLQTEKEHLEYRAKILVRSLKAEEAKH